MRGRIPDRFIDELLTRVDIVDVVERRVPLKKAGREWTACCPFHNERTPSFYVSPVKQFYHCFGCGAHGSAIKFLMDYERLEFVDAVEDLARSVGLTVPYEGEKEAAPREDRSELYALLDEVAQWFGRQLPGSAEAQAYCQKRGLDAAMIERFRLGWAPAAWDGLLRALGRTPARRKRLEQAGMLSPGEGGKCYDRFRERLMFPIHDRRGRVIAFGGRVINHGFSPHPAGEDQKAGIPARTSQQAPKYLNSPETPLFHKGRELFALWQVKQANAKLTRIVVVEGYMDVIALHQAGLPIAVATLGTATTPEHTELLFRAAPDVVFCFDGDRAGRAAAWKALDAALPRLRDGRQAYFLFLPEGEDPDSLIRREGKAGFENRLAHAMPLSDYFFDVLAHEIDLRSLDGRARLVERARPLLAKLPDGAFRELMAAELERRTGAHLHLEAPVPVMPPKAVQIKRSLVRSVIAILFAQPTLAEGVSPPYRFAALDEPGIPLLVELLELIRSRPGINAAILLEQFAARPEYPALSKLVSAALVGDDESQRLVFADALSRLEHRALLRRRDELSARAWAELRVEEKEELRRLLPIRENLNPVAD